MDWKSIEEERAERRAEQRARDKAAMEELERRAAHRVRDHVPEPRASYAEQVRRAEEEGMTGLGLARLQLSAGTEELDRQRREEVPESEEGPSERLLKAMEEHGIAPSPIELMAAGIERQRRESGS